MKLSLATGILTQTLPVVSETRISALLNRGYARKLQFDDLPVVRRSRKAATSDAPKRRRFRARTGRIKKKTTDTEESWRSRVLKNTVAAPDGTGSGAGVAGFMMCDPSSTDPDVGVLSCGFGKVCKRSQDSLLGGICATATTPIGYPNTRTTEAQAAKKKKRVNINDNLPPGMLRNQPRSLSKTSTGLAPASKPSLKACDPASIDADIGVLSCGNGRYCKASQNNDLGGECTDYFSAGDVFGGSLRLAFRHGGASKWVRQNQEESELVECDPTGADIGILSCGPGKSCEKSPDSNSGGFCVDPDPTARRLTHLTDNVGLCDPKSDVYGVFSCGCTKFDNETKSGTIACDVAKEVCFGSLYYGCYETCGTITTAYDFDNNILTSVKYCYDFARPTTEKLCVKYDSMFETCEIEYNDETCGYCQVTGDSSVSFDCSDVGGPTSTGGRLRGAANVIGACFQPVENGEYCALCRYNSYIPSKHNEIPIFFRGFGATTCYGLVVASKSSQIASDRCSEASAVASSSCCAYSCAVCGYNTVIPPSNFENPVTVTGLGETTCGELSSAAYNNFTIPQATCPTVSEAAAGICCESVVVCALCSNTAITPDRYEIPVFVPGFENITTCGDLAAYGDLTIPEDSCLALAQIAESACCAYTCDICGTSGVITSYYFDFNLTIPGFGEMTCGEIEVAAYGNSSLNSDTCPVVGEYAREVCCFQISSCELCGPDAIVPYSLDNVTTTIPGVGEATCYDIVFAANYGEPSLNASCSILAEVAQESCCRVVSTSCDVCGPYTAIPFKNDDFEVMIPGIGNGTCYELYYAGYLNGTLDDETCQDFTEIGRESCCEPLYYEPCYICGPGQNVSNTDANVTSPLGNESASCSLVEHYGLIGYFDEPECTYFTSLAAEPCCGFISTPTPTENPDAEAQGPGSSSSVRTVAATLALASSTCLWLCT